MKSKESKWFWMIIFMASVIAAAGGFFMAQYSVDTALAGSYDFIETNSDRTRFLASASANQPGFLSELQEAGTGFTAGEGAAKPPKDIRLIIFEIIQVILGFIGIILTVLVLYAGFLWWSARGDEDRVKKAKATLRNAVIGMIIITMSYSLVTFVLYRVFAPKEPELKEGGGYSFGQLYTDYIAEEVEEEEEFLD